jgi:hypothetical protein
MRLCSGFLVAAAVFAFMATIGCEKERVKASDPTGPQTAVRALVDAMNARDAAAVKNSFAPDTDPQKRYVEALAEAMSASIKLRDAATARFGKDDAHQLLGVAGPGEDAFRRFVEGRADVNGDNATIAASTGQTLTVRKIDGKWKIVPPTTGLDPAIAYLQQVTKALTDTADGISAKNIKSVDEAKSKIMQNAFTASTATP